MRRWSCEPQQTSAHCCCSIRCSATVRRTGADPADGGQHRPSRAQVPRSAPGPSGVDRSRPALCRGAIDAKGKAYSRKTRKRAATAGSSSRWAGAITQTTESTYGLAKRNLKAERTSLKARIKKIASRVQVPAGEKRGQISGYGTPAKRWQKQRRLQVLQARLAEVERQLESGHLSICRGGKRLATKHHNLESAPQTEIQWRAEWDAARWFITADGESDKAWGNETIRWHPTEGWLEIKLPAALAAHANRPHGPLPALGPGRLALPG